MTQLVIFDCDGVLVDSERPGNEVLAANLTRHGLPMTAEACEALYVGGTMASVEQEVRARGIDLPDTWLPDVYAEMYDRLRQGVDPIPGIVDLLDHLDRIGLPYCVGSNGPEEKMQITLGQTGLWDRFKDALFSAHTLGVAKPDPELYLIPARLHGVDPADCVVIEDSPTGATAAQRAGMRCLAYVPHGDGAQFRDLGAEVIRDMSQVAGQL